MADIQPTKFKALLGRPVIYFSRTKPNNSSTPSAALVAGIGLNGRLDLTVLYRSNGEGGGRVCGAVPGALPGDVDCTSTQLANAGTWIPVEMWDLWCDLKAEQEPLPPEKRKDLPFKLVYELYLQRGEPCPPAPVPSASLEAPLDVKVAGDPPKPVMKEKLK